MASLSPMSTGVARDESGSPPSSAPDLRRRRLLRQDVYEILLQELINGDLAPGERIRDDELARRLNVSRTPVREALARLGTAGLVDTAPNRYTRVTPLISADLQVVMEALAALYRLALEQTVSRLSADDEVELEILARRLEGSENPDPYLVVTALGRFCAERLDSPTLVQLISIAQPRLLRILRLNPAVLRTAGTVAGATKFLRAFRERKTTQLEAIFSEFFGALREDLRTPGGSAQQTSSAGRSSS